MSVVDGALRGVSVLVTGVTGFIGGSLARRLAEQEGAAVRGTGRRLDRVPQVAGIEGVRADLRDEAALAAAVQGQQVVFHLAAWLGSDKPNAEPAHEINVVAVERLVRLAAAAGVRRFVHLSSIAAYGLPPDHAVPEQTPLCPTLEHNDEYGATKAEGEQVARRVGAELGLDVVVIRPGMVYGPGSWTWSAQLAKMVGKGVPAVFGAGDGLAAPVYIDNLVDLMLLAATSPAAPGQCYNAVDAAVPWTEFMGYYGEMTGRRVRGMPLFLARTLATANELLPLGLPLNRFRLRHTQSRPTFPVDKALQELGYSPKVDVPTGMARARAWLQEVGVL